jgi:hypothetical protein
MAWEQEIRHPPAQPMRAQDPPQRRFAADLPPITALARPQLDERTHTGNIGDPQYAHLPDAHAGPQHGHEEGAIAQILDACHQGAGLLRVVPQVKLLKLNNARHRWLNRDEEDRLLVHCPRRLADLVVFLVETAARLSEALRLTWGDVDVDRKPRALVTFMQTEER